MSGKIDKLGKNISKIISLLKKIKLFFLFPGILIIGYLIGSKAGESIVSSVITGSKSVFFLYKLPLDYIITANLLSSENELTRTEGYYSLLDNNMIDADFLIERYKRESGFIKPVIIWLIGYSKEKDYVLGFLSEEYNGADMRIKLEILRTMKRMDKVFYADFIKSHNIDVDKMFYNKR